MDVLLILEIISLSSEIVTLRYFCIASSIFAILSSETDGRPESCLSWTSLFKLSAPLRMCCILTQTFFRKLFTNGNECHLAQCFCHTKHVSQGEIPTWWAKREETPCLTAVKPRLSVTASWLTQSCVFQGKPRHALPLG